MKLLILSALLLMSVGCFGQTYDTVKVIMLCSDTTHIMRTWFEDTGTSVKTNKRVYYTYDGGYNPDEVFYIIGYEVLRFVPAGWDRVDRQVFDYWEHEAYLNKYYYPLNKNIIVWQTK